MDKGQAIQAFWESFGIPAYDDGRVPKNAIMPYITYDVSMDSLGTVLQMSASLWYHSLTWEAVTAKADEISEHIQRMSPPAMEIDSGRIYITRGSPFAQRLTDPDQTIRRMLILINVEYFTAT